MSKLYSTKFVLSITLFISVSILLLQSVALGALSGQLLFTSENGIYVMNADGTSSQQVVSASEFPYITSARWSPDGNWIAFSGGTQVSNNQINIIQADGSNLNTLTGGMGSMDNPTFSPDGSTIAFHGMFSGNLYTINPDGTNLTSYGGSTAMMSRWSPNGQYIAGTNWGLTYSSDVFLYDFNTSSTTQITNHESGQAYQWPSWSPDGTKLAVISASNGGYDLFIMNADGTGQINLTADWSGSVGAPVWSLDGQYIIFTSDISGNADIWYTPVANFNPVQLTNTPQNEWISDIAPIVPEPISSILFLTGGAVLGGRNLLRRRKTTA